MKLRLVEAELFHKDGRTDGRTDRYDKFSSRCSPFLHHIWNEGNYSTVR